MTKILSLIALEPKGKRLRRFRCDTMLSLKRLSTQYAASFSFIIALISVILTLVRKSPETTESTSVRVFNIATNQGLRDAVLKELTSNSHTNRTIWETVSTSAVQAGLERVEPGAWIPPHSHETEEILLFYKGRGEAYDADGRVMELSPGSMVHVRRGAQHAFRNVGEEPLWLLWSFPRSSRNTDMFEFHQRYRKRETSDGP